MQKSAVPLLFLLLLLPRPVLAEEPKVQDIPPGEDKIVVVKEGEKAPFTGQLFDQATALRWSNWLLQYKLRLKQDLEAQKKIDQVEIDYGKRVLALERERYEIVTKDYQQKVADQQKVILQLNDEVKNPPFYKSPWFGFTLGVVVTGIAVGAGAVIIAQAR